ncbi:relaxin-3-like [Pseudophryne corroboree]|uniref:relaxin-3-like n=1 Tax=Pseudophryne corroboree TaxID=495146 RepID=UPI003081A04D
MALLRRSLLFAGLLLVLVPTLPAELRGRRSPVTASEYGVKLCGREFIRAVIFTCGGSRWKRLSPEQQEEPQLQQQERRSPGYPGRTADGLQDSPNKELNQLKLQALMESHLEQLQKSDIPIRQQNYFNSYDDDYNNYVPISESFNEYVRQVEDTTQKAQSASENMAAVGSDGFPWIKLSRRRREMSFGVAGICCKWGCTKSEISTLC